MNLQGRDAAPSISEGVSGDCGAVALPVIGVTRSCPVGGSEGAGHVISICDSSNLWALKWISFFRNLLQQGQPPNASEDSRGSLDTGTALPLSSAVACQGHSFQLRRDLQAPGSVKEVSTLHSHQRAWHAGSPSPLKAASLSLGVLCNFTQFDQAAPLTCFLGQ